MKVEAASVTALTITPENKSDREILANMARIDSPETRLTITATAWSGPGEIKSLTLGFTPKDTGENREC